MRRKLKITALTLGILIVAALTACAAALQFGSVGDHTLRSVAAGETPPTGGRHAPVWQRCGFYDAPVPVERAVHSIEHGAVWITYRPDLPSAQVDALRELARSEEHLLVSPYPSLAAPVVATVWGHQERLDTADASRLQEFIREYRNGPLAPERGGACDGPNLYFTGGAGTPHR
jgi:hypothetical protein